MATIQIWKVFVSVWLPTKGVPGCKVDFFLTSKFDTKKPVQQVHLKVHHHKISPSPLCLTPQPPLSPRMACLLLRKILPKKHLVSRYHMLPSLDFLLHLILKKGLRREPRVLYYG
jgi:hypothetical protein